MDLFAMFYWLQKALSDKKRSHKYYLINQNCLHFFHLSQISLSLYLIKCKNYTGGCPEDFVPSFQLMIHALMTPMLDEWASELAGISHQNRVKWLSSSSVLSMANNHRILLLFSLPQNPESNSKSYYHSVRNFMQLKSYLSSN